ELVRVARGLHGVLEGEAIDPGHRGDLLAVLAVDDEYRPDEVVRAQMVLADHPAERIGSPVAAGTLDEIHAASSRPRRVTHQTFLDRGRDEHAAAVVDPPAHEPATAGRRDGLHVVE